MLEISNTSYRGIDAYPGGLRIAWGLALVIALSWAPSSVFAENLHGAVRAQNKAAVVAALASGVDVDESDFVLGTPLHVAASVGNLEITAILIDSGADIEAVSEQQGSRAIHLAAQFGDAPMVMLLADSGADIEARDSYERTPLYRAAAGGSAEVVRLLLNRGAETRVKEGKYGWTPLHDAAHKGHFVIVRLLLDHGAEVNATDNTGLTPFMAAALPQSYSVVGDGSLLEYLVAQGADPNVRDTSGMSALGFAKHQANAGEETYFQQIVQVLLRLGAAD